MHVRMRHRKGEARRSLSYVCEVYGRRESLVASAQSLTYSATNEAALTVRNECDVIDGNALTTPRLKTNAAAEIAVSRSLCGINVVTSVSSMPDATA